ncbi:hypothetical protein MKZ38_010723 [Zalerion maritima]|uniref:F-box domain-containing protein n=1 Tax=Zalerion maritima TaxID=339359 RepID=A0AAD5RF98_9PEZI|nr:hypothetical protein MKZ38_010723 [Zalerion maritima]
MPLTPSRNEAIPSKQSPIPVRSLSDLYWPAPAQRHDNESGNAGPSTPSSRLINELPMELMLELAEGLPLDSLMALRGTCRRARNGCDKAFRDSFQTVWTDLSSASLKRLESVAANAYLRGGVKNILVCCDRQVKPEPMNKRRRQQRRRNITGERINAAGRLGDLMLSFPRFQGAGVVRYHGRRHRNAVELDDSVEPQVKLNIMTKALNAVSATVEIKSFDLDLPPGTISVARSLELPRTSRWSSVTLASIPAFNMPDPTTFAGDLPRHWARGLVSLSINIKISYSLAQELLYLLTGISPNLRKLSISTDPDEEGRSHNFVIQLENTLET